MSGRLQPLIRSPDIYGSPAKKGNVIKQISIVFFLFIFTGYTHAPISDDTDKALQNQTFSSQYRPSYENIANPERGFYLHPGDCDKVPFKAEKLAAERRGEQKISLVLCIFYLEDFKDKPISAAKLAFFQQQIEAVRAAGLKVILRFAYTYYDPPGDKQLPPGDDAPLFRVREHLSQLEPYLRRNRDVIALVESGFVGTWGEGYYSQNFGNAGAEDWEKRKAVVDELLRILPGRMVLVRRPKMKMEMYFPSPGKAVPVAAGSAYGDAPIARVGYHNDCFLASPDDNGTYEAIAVEKAYLAEDTKYVPMGGETCVPNPPRSLCGGGLGEPGKPGDALKELERFHYSYLNGRRSREVLDSWADGGCIEKVTQSLGYRFSLVSSVFPPSVRAGSRLPVKVGVRNTGWAAPFNSRPVYLVLRHSKTKALYSFKLAANARGWQAQTRSLIDEKVQIPPTMPAGTYQLLLWLPEPSVAAPGQPEPSWSLHKRPEYAIRMANLGVWDMQAGKETGFNLLSNTLWTKAAKKLVLNTIEVTP